MTTLQEKADDARAANAAAHAACAALWVAYLNALPAAQDAALADYDVARAAAFATERAAARAEDALEE